MQVLSLIKRMVLFAVEASVFYARVVLIKRMMLFAVEAVQQVFFMQELSLLKE